MVDRLSLLAIRMPASLHPNTLADLDALGDDARAELIDGVIYERPVTTFDHGRIAFRIAMKIAPAYEDGVGGPGGWWIMPENDFEAAGREVFRPDALGWTKARMPEPPRDGRANVVPDWVCEVISGTNRAHDEVVKRAAYARIGVRWWWLVDPTVKALTAHVLGDCAWHVLERLEGAATARVAPFEAVGLEMSEWWR